MKEEYQKKRLESIWEPPTPVLEYGKMIKFKSSPMTKEIEQLHPMWPSLKQKDSLETQPRTKLPKIPAIQSSMLRD